MSDLSEDQQKRLALDKILDAWDSGLEAGIQPEILATTAIYAALTDMVDNYGEDAVAGMMDEIPQRIRNGEFTLARGTTS